MHCSRRSFLRHTTLALAASSLAPAAPNPPDPEPSQGSRPLIVSTWPFGKPANEAALASLHQNGSLLDAVERGIQVVESDPKNPSVGLNGLPNAAGIVQLDACIMLGPGHKAGSVAALEGIRHPISAARRVMERTPHVMLVGEGARMFALQEGLEAVATDSRTRHEAWWAQRARTHAPAPAPPAKPANHDTIALLVLGADGNLAGGCSTSGWSGKLPGRVGDSPILGSGLYVDNEVGAAGATGLGENVMRYCGSFLVVEFMRQGLAPTDACLAAIRRIASQDPKGNDLSIHFIALDKSGRFGAAGTAKGFEYAVTTRSASRLLQAAALTDAAPAPVGGNRRP